MGAVLFSDVHADAGAIAALRDCIRQPIFAQRFGPIDCVVNLGDLLHRGNHPKETLEAVHAIAREYRLVSVMGNHDHAFLHRLPVSGSDAASLARHEQIRGSPLLAIFDGMPMEWVDDGMLFVHGGPLDLGSTTLRLKCWQRLGKEPGDSYAGYFYTPEMAFSALRTRGLMHLCCGHQHTSLCCQQLPGGIQPCRLDYLPVGTKNYGTCRIQEAKAALSVPSILRVGACSGENPEFAYTDFQTFSFLRIA